MKDLRLILQDREYTDPDDILINSITDGIHAKKLEEKLLDRGEELTLAKAIEIGHNTKCPRSKYALFAMRNLPS